MLEYEKIRFMHTPIEWFSYSPLILIAHSIIFYAEICLVVLALLHPFVLCLTLALVKKNKLCFSVGDFFLKQASSFAASSTGIKCFSPFSVYFGLEKGRRERE